DPDRAEAEMPDAVSIDLSDAFPGLKQFVAATTGLVAFVATPPGAWMLIAIVWVLLTAVNPFGGLRPTIRAAGSLHALVRVAAGLGLLQILSLAVWAVMVTCRSATPTVGCLAAGITFLNLVATVPIMQPPVCLRGTREKLPQIDDEAFLKRVAELAQNMNV